MTTDHRDVEEVFEANIARDRFEDEVRCRCRRFRPGSSGGMLVFVEDAAESVVSSDVESVDSIGLDDPLGEWAQGCCGAERAVGPVLIVEGFVLAQRME